MSLTSLAIRAAVERTPRRAAAAVASADGGLESVEFGPVDGGPNPPPPPVATALQTLLEFVPGEVIGLYWLVVPVGKTIAEWIDPNSPNYQVVYRWIYFGFIAFTPVLLILLSLSVMARKGEAFPKVNRWPWWKAIASMVAFAVWALAVPNNPIVESQAVQSIFWAVATLASILLSVLDPIVEKWIFPRPSN